ncbi:hypothetical protein LGQ02_10350 [Bacillus shivajii]|uniref:hypothetical protein n=1 Tax=Bacillus shivajii TaxID=1983719 RepID=UPI001CFBA7B3|nr:hypothetical protein [Bacillus shivajii]UCZ55091.1 hypothetical protein LGQ02_10350 [Bacillus shivajii]
MRILFVIFSLLHIPFVITYLEYSERFYGDIPFVTYGNHFFIFYVAFAVIIGVLASKIPLHWFIIVNACVVVTHGFLSVMFISEEHAYWFSPLTPVMVIVLSAFVYIAIQAFVRLFTSRLLERLN